MYTYFLIVTFNYTCMKAENKQDFGVNKSTPLLCLCMIAFLPLTIRVIKLQTFVARNLRRKHVDFETER